MIKKATIAVACVTLTIGTAIAQEEANLEEGTKLEQATVSEDGNENTTTFVFEEFAEKYLLIDEQPVGFPNQAEYTTMEELKAAIVAWCLENKDLVNPDVIATYEQKELRRQSAEQQQDK